MKALPVLLIGLALAAPAQATSLKCSGPEKAQFKTLCGDVELAALINNVNAAVARLLGQSDLLTAMLLKRDQRWFEDVIGSENIGPFEGRNDENYGRIHKLLKARLATLSRLQPGALKTPVGNWANALASAKVAKGGADTLTLTLKAHLNYPNMGQTYICEATATLKPAADGWYSGKGKADEPREPDPDIGPDADMIKLRMQGNTLRVVIVDGGRGGFCNGVDLLTASYFPAGGTASKSDPGLAARTVSPSFGCASVANSDEEEICSDPELAKLDTEINAHYRAAMVRLDAKTAEHLRADQRAWVRENSTGYEAHLAPGWDKKSYDVHHSSDARYELLTRLAERAFMLANIEDKREGLQGLWFAHHAMLSIAPEDGKTGLIGRGGKVAIGEYKSSCTFYSPVTLENGAVNAKEEFPELGRDGVVLVFNPRDPDNDDDFFDKDGKVKIAQPGYCSRMRSPKARLFPIKMNETIVKQFDRIR